MAFVIDNLLYSLSAYIWMGKGVKFEEPWDTTVSADDVTVLMPAKYEEYEAMKQTIENITKQSIVPKIWILLDEEDKKTIEHAKRLKEEFQNYIEVKVYKNNSKADALNKAINMVKTKYVLIIDVGDVFENKDAIENLIKVAEKGYDAVNSVLKAQKTDKLWKKFVHIELNNWTRNVLRTIKKRFKFIPLSGTGLLLRTEALRKVGGFPPTLAEDATLGLKIKDVAITNKSILLYNLPKNLKGHLKQRGRWIGGYIQTLKYSSLRQKIVYASPLVLGIMPISTIVSLLQLISLKFMFDNILTYAIDFIASILFIILLVNLFINTRDLKVFLLPVWWSIVGLSFYIGLYYAIKNKWYYSEKDTDYKLKLKN